MRERDHELEDNMIYRCMLAALALVAVSGCFVDVADAGRLPDLATEVARAELSPTMLVGKVVAYATTTGSNSGPRQTFGPGIYSANAGELSAVGNDATRLLELAPAMRVQACLHEAQSNVECRVFENLTGANKTFVVAPGVSRLIIRALVVGYRDANFAGVTQGFEVGRHEAGKGNLSTVGNDAISSIRMAPGLSLRLCSDNPETTTGGNCGILSGNVPLLSSTLNNRASWLEVRPVTVAYRNTQLAGTSQRFGAGIFTASQLSSVGNDAISSLLVNEGVSTRICSDNPNTTVGGVCGIFPKSVLVLTSNLDNRTSWIENKHTVILQPINEDMFGGQQVTLRGYAIDPEDGQLAGSRLRWLSSRDGFLGTGNVLTVQLSADDFSCDSGGTRSATHVISLVATDSQSNRTTTTRVYRIRIVC
jgi:hypothetical protein